jgi:hypothetical protein
LWPFYFASYCLPLEKTLLGVSVDRFGAFCRLDAVVLRWSCGGFLQFCSSFAAILLQFFCNFAVAVAVVMRWSCGGRLL